MLPNCNLHSVSFVHYPSQAFTAEHFNFPELSMSCSRQLLMNVYPAEVEKDLLSVTIVDALIQASLLFNLHNWVIYQQHSLPNHVILRTSLMTFEGSLEQDYFSLSLLLLILLSFQGFRNKMRVYPQSCLLFYLQRFSLSLSRAWDDDAYKIR